MVGVTERDLSVLLFQRDRGIDDVRVEVLPPTFFDEASRLGMSERRIVNVCLRAHGNHPQWP